MDTFGEVVLLNNSECQRQVGTIPTREVGWKIMSHRVYGGGTCRVERNVCKECGWEDIRGSEGNLLTPTLLVGGNWKKV